MFSKVIRRTSRQGGNFLVKRGITIATQSDADKYLEKMRLSQEKFYHYSQKDVDTLFETVSDKMRKHSMELAKMAVKETSIGCVEDKTLKNIYATEQSVAMYKDTKTVGVIEHNPTTNISRIAEPVGPICAILPCTNPTATVIFKSLYSLKTRNCIVFLPHPRSQKCSAYTADLIHQYAMEAGAPEGVVMNCVSSREISDYVMRHKETKFLLATGGTDMVKACYSVGKPAIGVGPGNTPVVVDGTYDLRETVHSIMIGKTFDWGVPCITEQSVIVLDSVYEMVKDLLKERGVYFLGEKEKQKVARVFISNGRVNPDIVGKSPHYIASCAGIEIPSWTLVLGVEVSRIGDQEIFSHEKMSPILAIYRAILFEDAVEMARELVLYGGPGHSACLYTEQEDHIQLFQERVPAYHININMPALGGIGIRYNHHVAPTMTVGCGVWGGSMASVNIGPLELIQMKTVARKQMDPHRDMTPLVIRKPLLHAVQDLSLPKGNVIIIKGHDDVPDDFLDFFRTLGRDLMVLYSLTSDTECIEKTLSVLDGFDPAIIFVLGEKDLLDTAKILRLCYENRKMTIEKLTEPFLEDETHLKDLRREVLLVAVPTIPGSADMSPFTQHILHKKNNTTFYIPSISPNAVIYDPACCEENKDKILVEGFATLLQGMEAFVSIYSTEETRKLLFDPIQRLLFELEKEEPCQDVIYDACIHLSVLIARNGVGLGTSMAVKMSSFFEIPFCHVLAAAIPPVMEFNSSSHPTRGVASPHYPYPMAGPQYKLLAISLGLQDKEQLISILWDIRWKMGFETIHSLVNKDMFINHLNELSELTFGDSLHRTNPRMALLPDIYKLYKEIYFR